MGGDGRGHGEENGDVVGGRLWLRGEIGVREGEGVVKVDKSSVQSSKNWNRLVVRPSKLRPSKGISKTPSCSRARLKEFIRLRLMLLFLSSEDLIRLKSPMITQGP